MAETHGRGQSAAQGVQIPDASDGDVARMKTLMAPHMTTAIATLEKDGKPARKFFDEYTKSPHGA